MTAVKIPLSGGASLPRDLREWATWANNANAPHVRTDDATGYNVGQGVWFGRDTDGTVKLFVGDENGNKILWDGQDLSVVGNIVLGVANFLRSGQTAYDTGTGFFLGNDGGTPKVSIGNSAGNKLTWDGDELNIVGRISASTNFAYEQLSAEVTGVSAEQTILTIDVGEVEVGQVVLISCQARMDKGGTGGATVFNIVTNLNTTAVLVPSSGPFNAAGVGWSGLVQNATTSWDFNIASSVIITGAGHLELELHASSGGSNGTVQDNATWLSALVIL